MWISQRSSGLAVESSASLFLDFFILHILILRVPECSPALIPSPLAFLHELVPAYRGAHTHTLLLTPTGLRSVCVIVFFLLFLFPQNVLPSE